MAERGKARLGVARELSVRRDVLDSALERIERDVRVLRRDVLVWRVGDRVAGQSSPIADPIETKAENPYRMIEIQNEGGSPQYWITHKGECQGTWYKGEKNTFIMVKVDDVVTAYGMSYKEDNTHNYGAPNVEVIANIRIFSDGKLVAKGIENVGYIVGSEEKPKQ